ncbi:hypothetical protein I6A84_02190 [Frankia sp. CNm7]|uniref:Uncharacterized protein n=1 Tax=Frankia nepalensis TaxID=1836974 RepID=A0A937RMC4_9ACTN|nr:hypothetical protein [Frankia nepalensis]MBL7499872.1 hypothetical protein [Frankia nepalensis]MBL7512310.1 hypothetical protein [Frankia nepalensis]MBL7516967.1 hypothetical protein [Frankia nepalensis]MBL7629018.1 hypothetical protein [Frankia nepalensis]
MSAAERHSDGPEGVVLDRANSVGIFVSYSAREVDADILKMLYRSIGRFYKPPPPPIDFDFDFDIAFTHAVAEYPSSPLVAVFREASATEDPAAALFEVLTEDLAAAFIVASWGSKRSATQLYLFKIAQAFIAYSEFLRPWTDVARDAIQRLRRRMVLQAWRTRRSWSLQFFRLLIGQRRRRNRSGLSWNLTLNTRVTRGPNPLVASQPWPLAGEVPVDQRDRGAPPRPILGSSSCLRSSKLCWSPLLLV